jgi:hypothetical protein
MPLIMVTSLVLRSIFFKVFNSSKISALLPSGAIEMPEGFANIASFPTPTAVPLEELPAIDCHVGG